MSTDDILSGGRKTHFNFEVVVVVEWEGHGHDTSRLWYQKIGYLEWLKVERAGESDGVKYCE